MFFIIRHFEFGFNVRYGLRQHGGCKLRLLGRGMAAGVNLLQLRDADLGVDGRGVEFLVPDSG